jgi:hypothetical protein
LIRGIRGGVVTTQESKLSDTIYKDESYRIIGACMEVYNEMGSGFLEAVYQELLEYEFTDRGIPFIPQAQSTFASKNEPFDQSISRISWLN